MPTYGCPIKDCDETAPTAGAIQGHISGTGYGPHQGESGYAYDDDELLVEDSDDETDEVSDDSGSDSDPEQDGAPDSAEGGTEADDGQGSSAASTDGGAGIVPEADAHTPGADGSDGSTAEPDECPDPDCANTEHFRSADQHLEDYRAALEPEHVEALEAGDHVCQVCGGVF